MILILNFEKFYADFFNKEVGGGISLSTYQR